MRLLAALLLAASGPTTVFTVQDPRIDENSGMADLPVGTVVTNDSGDTGRVFLLDGAGRTVGVTTYGAATDVEALAPAGRDAVWVGDLGDNDERRADVVVRRVVVGRGERTSRAPAYRLVYPDGAHDAETLLRDPRTGRLYVVTKALTGGTAYAAPARLDPDRPNRLRAVGRVPLWATDGAFLGGGRRVLVRGYDRVALLAFPSWRVLATAALPEQQQGESLSVGPGDRVRIGSEGVRQPVLRVPLPASRSPAEADDTPAAPREDGRVDGDGDSGGEQAVAWAVLAAVLAAAAGMLGLARARRRG